MQKKTIIIISVIVGLYLSFLGGTTFGSINGFKKGLCFVAIKNIKNSELYKCTPEMEENGVTLIITKK